MVVQTFSLPRKAQARCLHHNGTRLE